MNNFPDVIFSLYPPKAVITSTKNYTLLTRHSSRKGCLKLKNINIIEIGIID